jgi:hypothetical protein
MSRRTIEQPWPRSAAEAQLLQERLRGQVVTKDQLGVVQRVAGVDAYYSVDRVWAAIAVMTLPVPSGFFVRWRRKGTRSRAANKQSWSSTPRPTGKGVVLLS